MKKMNVSLHDGYLYDYTAVLNFRSKKSDYAGSPLLGSIFSKVQLPIEQINFIITRRLAYDFSAVI